MEQNALQEDQDQNGGNQEPEAQGVCDWEIVPLQNVEADKR